MEPNPNFTNIPTDFHRLGSATSPIKLPPNRPIRVVIALAVIGIIIAVVTVLLLIASCSPSSHSANLRVTATPMATYMQTSIPTVGPATPSTPSTAPGGGSVPGSSPSPTPVTGTVPLNTPVPGQSTSVPPASPQTILATDASRWHYTGVWTMATRAICESDTCVFSNQRGATASITFIGTYINLLGGKNKNGGIGNVRLTNTSGTIVSNAAFDCYAKAGTEATLYTSPVLSRGSYTLTITVTGTSDKAALNSRVFLDSVVITP